MTELEMKSMNKSIKK
jgi:hypothetical protein